MGKKSHILGGFFTGNIGEAVSIFMVKIVRIKVMKRCPTGKRLHIFRAYIILFSVTSLLYQTPGVSVYRPIRITVACLSCILVWLGYSTFVKPTGRQRAGIYYLQA